MKKVLRLNPSGMPMHWLLVEAATTLYSKKLVLWEMGEQGALMRGGYNRDGERSMLDISPVIATKGHGKSMKVRSFSNAMLFRRDNYVCLYCGQIFFAQELTRDHVVPRAQGGADSWTNVVAACKRCNHAKGNRTPEQANMLLLAVPFTPNPFEYLYLTNRHIIADQMDYLTKQFSSQRKWKSG
ncbi:restriction endonuclease [Candidatus Endobugula sertula]|uniref:Restriction endonuclease n=1 Tax=Candidatus Endobugula sertula TaxID=62101 RepID=A0A1D2QR83_9GAMM|nr:restriction endonuclease [Candidatus Endobugula sertula]